jgi:DNA-binding IclR family transcriptional regulator
VNKVTFFSEREKKVQILEVMKEAGSPLTPIIISQKTGLDKMTVNRNLSELQELLLVEKQGNKIWVLKGNILRYQQN